MCAVLCTPYAPLNTSRAPTAVHVRVPCAVAAAAAAAAVVTLRMPESPACACVGEGGSGARARPLAKRRDRNVGAASQSPANGCMPFAGSIQPDACWSWMELPGAAASPSHRGRGRFTFPARRARRGRAAGAGYPATAGTISYRSMVVCNLCADCHHTLSEFLGSRSARNTPASPGVRAPRKFFATRCAIHAAGTAPDSCGWRLQPAAAPARASSCVHPRLSTPTGRPLRDGLRKGLQRMAIHGPRL